MQFGSLHIHSNNSFDGKISIGKIKELFSKKGFTFIILTEHSESFEDSKSWDSFFEEVKKNSDKDFLIIPGIEYNFNDGLHILVFGQNKYLQIKNEEDIALLNKSENIFSIVAHPVSPRRQFRYDCFDGIEIYNKRYDGLSGIRTSNLFLALGKLNKNFTVGLDFHKYSDFQVQGIVLNSTKLEKTEIIKKLKSGMYKNFIRFSESETLIFNGVINLVDIIYLFSFTYWKRLISKIKTI